MHPLQIVHDPLLLIDLLYNLFTLALDLIDDPLELRDCFADLLLLVPLLGELSA